MAVTVSVYGKRGLKRGDPIFNASFSVTEPGTFVFSPRVTRPGPLTGVNPTYFVETSVIWWDGSWRQWFPRYGAQELEVFAPHMYPWSFDVRDGETHEVWLDRS